jgi:serine/threonine-protein kinase
LIDTTLDRKYRIIRLLGKGGMGSVYEAHHCETGQRVAVKVISERLLSAGGDAVRRFRREARAVNAIDSEHTVEVLDSGTDAATGQLYLVMEYLEGEDLQKTIDRCGPLDINVAIAVAVQALEGLKKAHEARIIHRDIKPSNIFLTAGPEGKITVKLLDFGIAKINVDPLGAPQTTGLTSSDGFLGSPLYMSPEQVQSSRDVDHRTDLWSLASTIYCALAGRAPFQHVLTVGRLIIDIYGASPPRLNEIAPWVPAEVATAVHGALKSWPDERYPSAAAMLNAFRALLPEGFVLHKQMLVPSSSRKLDPSATAASPDAEPPSTRLLMPSGTTILLSEPENAEEPDLPFQTTEQEAPIKRAQGESRGPLDAGAGPIQMPASVASSEQPIPAPDHRRQRRNAIFLVIAMVAAAAGVAGVAQLRSGDLPEPVPAANAPFEPSQRPEQSQESAAPPPAPTDMAPSRRRSVTVAILPKDAQVEIDGEPALVRDGTIEISGPLGSVHRIAISKAKSTSITDVVVTEMGAVPPRVELRLPTAATAAARSSGAAPRTTSKAAAPRATADDPTRRPE